MIEQIEQEILSDAQDVELNTLTDGNGDLYLTQLADVVNVHNAEVEALELAMAKQLRAMYKTMYAELATQFTTSDDALAYSNILSTMLTRMADLDNYIVLTEGV